MGVISAITTNPLIYGSITALVGVVTGEYVRRRHQQKKEAREWYGEAKGYLSNLQQAARKATAYRDGVNHDTLHELLNGLDEEMMRHANDDRKRVDDEARVELAVIAAYTTGLASLSEKSLNTNALDFIKRVQGHAIEDYDGDYDMDDLEALFSGFDFGEFAKTDRNVDIDEQVAERLRSRFSDESLEAGYPTSIEEALNIPIEETEDAFETEGFLNTVVDDSLEAFVNMVIDLAKETHERMDARQERL
ncbi:hypothetical protein [Natrinema salsiterrestre]|uniref:Uncharacterized protein n=1 Tax=Natrinema salsiterrestre TaxID=2950540 RepID=A0A9Q4Q1P8_9EURY|nr:hypothetical protein [Natrinema salsiterrestre]MDF9744528.1 hypothetical protein [Natrinema salsiterrestre]